ncbi:MAG: hypothetical protein ACYTJ0_10845, partial [Planctomycetota bacterium]
NVELSRRFETRLAERGFRVLPDGELSIACARWEPSGWTPDDVDRLQGAVAERVRSTGDAWFSTVVHEGRAWLRLNMVNLHARERHVDRIVTRMARAAGEAERAAAGESPPPEVPDRSVAG